MSIKSKLKDILKNTINIENNKEQENENERETETDVTVEEFIEDEQEETEEVWEAVESDVEMDITETDKNKVWAFCAGQYSGDFRGNPKWLFIYMNYYRKDITTYWLCPDKELAEQIRGFGFRAFIQGTVQGEQAMDRTGVLVAEQVKAYIPLGLSDVKYLNLWHGVGGVKKVERAFLDGRLTTEIAKKYIDKNKFYRNNEIYLSPSPLIDKVAKNEIGVDESRIIRAGYPRCMYQKKYKEFSSFNHDLINERELPSDTKMIAYVPTYRNNPSGELFSLAFPELESLIKVCEKEHLLMIFKMHPLLEKELSFVQAKEAYQDCKWLYFWDNKDDFYEILSDIDLCIMDYSSIFTDFVAAGVKNDIRYIVDFDPADLEFELDYDEATIGRKCYDYNELLEALTCYDDDDLSEGIERINKLHWPYATEDTFDKIVDQTLKIEKGKEEFPTLYSFDIFDTLISRKVLDPVGIFYIVKEKLAKRTDGFSDYFIKNYPAIRKNSESNVREYYNRSKAERDDDRCEIQFEYIFKRMQVLYHLTDEQVEVLKQLELEVEYDNSIPIKERIEYLKKLVADGQEVILVSDMDLSKEFITKLLEKADPVLAQIPLYLSSEIGYQKSAKNLYVEIYKHYAPDYRFGKWIHYGDNKHSDFNMPKSLNIKAELVEKPTFNEYEKELIDTLQTSDAYLIAANMARFRTLNDTAKAEFARNYVSLLFVPYVYWAVHDAIDSGDEIIYFISRDGHHLKRIADAIIEAEGLSIETKYIYASRRTWRIPSFIDHIDVGFWGQGYGNLAKVSSFPKLLKALDMEESEFREIFPEMINLNEDTDFSEINIGKLTEVFSTSEKYEKFLLAKAAEERKSVCAYHAQEMDVNKKFSIVEYWGRGYTQENFTRLWHEIKGVKEPVVFYYSRSTLPSDEYNIRKNFTTFPIAQQFIEAIFANVPYHSIEKYEQIDGIWEPVIEPIEYDKYLYHDMMVHLPEFAKVYCEIEFSDRYELGRELIDFAMGYYGENSDKDMFVKNLAKLVDSVELFGDKKEYAKELTMDDLEEIKNGKKRNQISKNITMSYHRASDEVKEAFKEMFQIVDGEKLTSGWKINDDEIERKRQYKEKLNQYKSTIQKTKKLYEQMAFKYPVENKIVFLALKKTKDIFNLKYLQEMLGNQDKYVVESIALKNSKLTTEKLVKKLATAKYIIITKPVPEISKINFRDETKVILAPENSIYYSNAMLCRKFKIREENEYNDLTMRNQMDIIQIASKNLIESYNKVFNVSTMTDFSITGNCATDVYFDKEYAMQVKNKLEERIPEIRGRKVIIYLPINRFRSQKAKYLHLLDMEKMARELSDEYFVLINRKASFDEEITNVIEVQDFCMNTPKGFTLKELMIAADVIIGDYRWSVFEAPLLHKPIYLSDWDAEVYTRGRCEAIRYSELQCGERIKDTPDLIEKLKNIDKYDYSIQERFVDRYLRHCDGQSSKRLYDCIMNDEWK